MNFIAKNAVLKAVRFNSVKFTMSIWVARITMWITRGKTDAAFDEQQDIHDICHGEGEDTQLGRGKEGARIELVRSTVSRSTARSTKTRPA